MTKKITSFDLTEIEDPTFLKNLSIKELKILSEEIRDYILKSVSKTGGHLSSNLGVVELTIALHYVFNNSNDKLIFDVGHQSYTHKILTGRAKDFSSLRKMGGISGFMSYKESKYDVWESGHSSNSLSALMGFLKAKEMGEDIGECVALIGDSSIASGMAFEALNQLGSSPDYHPIIILNDNKMSISKSVGSLNKVFSLMRSNKFFRGLKWFVNKITPNPIRNIYHNMLTGLKSLIQNDNIFETLGFDYFGPIDGNNIKAVIKELNRVKKLKKPCVVHIITTKGKGYEKAMNDTSGVYHNVKPFDLKSGLPLVKRLENEYTFSDVVFDYLLRKRKSTEFVAIDSAMVGGILKEKFNKEYRGSFVDVGISEEHAASFAAGLALNNKRPVLLYYSTFLQRAYDQVLNDIARQNLPVIIGIDRAGVVGEDGQTHEGIYDISMLNAMPNMKICMGYNAKELRGLFEYAFSINCPVAIRYPKGIDYINLDQEIMVVDESWTILHEGSKGIVISYGPDLLRIKNIVIDNKLDCYVVNARFIKPLDYDLLDKLFQMELPILVYEQVVQSGSLFSNILLYKASKNYSSRVVGMNLCSCQILPHGTVNEVLDSVNLGDKDILKGIEKLYEN